MRLVDEAVELAAPLAAIPKKQAVQLLWSRANRAGAIIRRPAVVS